MSIATLTSNETGANSLIDINANFVDLDTTKADLVSPTFTGSPVAPTQSANDNSTKLATTAYVDNASTGITVETTTGTTHSLTTVANEKVIVWAKGNVSYTAAGAQNGDVLLNYNGVQKDIVRPYAENITSNKAFALMYTETPGAGTQDITVTSTLGSLGNVVIIVMKII